MPQLQKQPAAKRRQVPVTLVQSVGAAQPQAQAPGRQRFVKTHFQQLLDADALQVWMGHSKWSCTIRVTSVEGTACPMYVLQKMFSTEFLTAAAGNYVKAILVDSKKS